MILLNKYVQQHPAAIA